MHDNLRISVTDRCNIRCFYCMPETDVQFVEPRARFWISKRSSASCASPSALGIRKLRVTGGEPLVRRDLPVLIRRLAAIPGIRGSGADHQRRAAGANWREPLYDAGLRRINVHLDTLDRERFQQITRRDDLGQGAGRARRWPSGSGYRRSSSTRWR